MIHTRRREESYLGPLGAATLFWLFSLNPTAYADTGIDYLSAQQNADGSFGNTLTSLATPIQSTAEVVRALQLVSQTNQPIFGPAITFLNNDTESNSEFLARKILVNAQAGGDVSSHVSELLTHRNLDGGFGDLSGFDGAVLDTAFALEALTVAGVPPGPGINGAVAFLLNRQQPDGGWTDGANFSTVYLTALALRALAPYRVVFSGVSNALASGQAFLLAQRDAGNQWAETFQTALALIALFESSASPSALQASVDGLRGAQLGNGSWEDDTYTTALALQALHLADNPPPNPALSIIRGRVVDALTGLPLSGVSAVLTGPTPGSTVTGSDGGFVFDALQPGPYSLQLSLSDYVAITATTATVAGQTIDFGTLPLTKVGAATTATVLGTITDASTGSPLTGVSVTVSGVGAPAVTGADGTYQISNVPPGAVTIQASKTGFSTATTSAQIVAGGVAVFSPALSPVAGETTAIRGTVTHGETGAPLSGVTITVSGSTSASATTDAQGNYQIDGVNPGTVTVQATATGFDSVSITTQVFQFNVLIFSPKLYPAGTSPPNANTSGVTGIVLDAGTNQPLSGVNIEATFGSTTQTFTSGPDGRFEITGLTNLDLELSFSLTGYVTSTFAIPLPPLATLDIGQVRLRQEDVTELLPDLIVQTVSTQGVTNDPATLALTGTLNVDVANRGTTGVPAGVTLLAFHDANGNGTFDAGVDAELGQAATANGLNPTETETVSVALSGSLPFRDAPIHVFVDSTQSVAESNETNNVNTSSSACRVNPPPAGQLVPKLKWQWRNVSGKPNVTEVFGPVAVGQLTDDNGDGLINQADIPDLVFGAAVKSLTAPNSILVALSGDDGRELWTVEGLNVTHRGSISLGDIDGDGIVEIVVAEGNRSALLAFEHDGTLKWTTPSGPTYTIDLVSDGVSIVDLDHDGLPEIVQGRRVYNADGALRWEGTRDKGGPNDGSFVGWGFASIAADIDLDGSVEVIAGRTVYAADGTVRWHRGEIINDGFNAVGNFDADDFAEIVLVTQGRVFLLEHTGETIWGPVFLPAGGRGGPPTVADFDGDGQPEIGVAGASRYTVFETNGSIKWSSPTQDLTSGMTGSSVFDFEADGRAEVLYSDEVNFRIYDGTTGAILVQIHNTSVTTLEYPNVVDLDNDGQAEIIVTSNTHGSNPTPGVRVYEAETGGWAPTRNLWNQHSYHITNINDDGTIPANEQPSWLTHNTYRLNTFLDRDPLSSADLTASVLRVVDNGAGQPLSLRVRVGNGGAIASLDQVLVSFFEGDPAAGGTLLGSVTIGPLAPGAFQEVQLDGIAGLSGTLDLFAVVDADGRVNECNEANNAVSIPGAVTTNLGAISVSTDQAVYGANSPMVLQAQVTNTGALPGAFLVALEIEDAAGNLVQGFGAQAVGPLASGASTSVAESFNTGAIIAGLYRLRGVLHDEEGVILAEATSPFEIRHSLVAGETGVTLRTTTDRPVYHTTDVVQVQDLIQNVSVNTIVSGALLRLTIVDAANQPVFAQDVPLNALAPGGILDIPTPFSLQAAAVGNYRVLGSVIDGQSQTVLATSEALYQVQYDLSRALTGTVEAQLATLVIGGAQTCTFTVKNSGSIAVANLEVHHAVVNIATEQLVSDQVVTFGLQPNEENIAISSFATTGFSAGDHACVLQANIAGTLETLAFAPFTLNPPPVQIDAELKLGSRGRLLVLLDPGSAAGDADPFGPQGAPDLGAQRSFLEALLTAAGWSYTVVEDVGTFGQKFRSGGYTVYALFTEQEKLSEQLQKELREAVFRGEGLVVTGEHDACHNRLADALGIEHIGQLADAISADILPGPLGDGGSVLLIPGDKAFRIDRVTAASAGTYQTTSGPTTDDAVTTNAYGRGKSVFVGFDLLATATQDGPSSIAAQTLLAALVEVHPAAITQGLGSVVPIDISLQNQGIPASVQATLALPAGTTVIDAGVAQLDTNTNTLTWTLELGTAEARNLTFWLRLPDLSGPLTLTAQIAAGPDSQTVAFTGTADITLNVEQPEGLQSIIDRMQVLIDSGHPHATALANAKALVQQALGNVDPGAAIPDVLKADDRLLGITDVDVIDIRAALGIWVRWAAQFVTTIEEGITDCPVAQACGAIPDENFGQFEGIACALPQGSGTVTVFNQAELDAYLVDFGFDGSTVKNLNVKFNPIGDIDIRSPCHVNVAGEVGNLNINASSMRVFGRKGVGIAEDYANTDVGITLTGGVTLVSTEDSAGFFKGLTLNTPNICIQAARTAKIGMDHVVNADSIEIISTGDFTDSHAQIRQGTNVTANTVRLEASREAAIGEQVIANVDDLTITSTADKVLSEAIIKQAAQVTTNTLSLTSGNKATVGMDTAVTVNGNFEMDAQSLNKCTVANTASVSLVTKSGNCAPVLP